MQRGPSVSVGCHSGGLPASGPLWVRQFPSTKGKAPEGAGVSTGVSTGVLPRCPQQQGVVAPARGPLRVLEGVPGLPGAPQEEAGLTRKLETSHVGGATCRTPRIPRSALEKDAGVCAASPLGELP